MIDFIGKNGFQQSDHIYIILEFKVSAWDWPRRGHVAESG